MIDFLTEIIIIFSRPVAKIGHRTVVARGIVHGHALPIETKVLVVCVYLCNTDNNGILKSLNLIHATIASLVYE